MPELTPALLTYWQKIKWKSPEIGRLPPERSFISSLEILFESRWYFLCCVVVWLWLWLSHHPSPLAPKLGWCWIIQYLEMKLVFSVAGADAGIGMTKIIIWRLELCFLYLEGKSSHFVSFNILHRVCVGAMGSWKWMRKRERREWNEQSLLQQRHWKKPP